MMMGTTTTSRWLLRAATRGGSVAMLLTATGTHAARIHHHQAPAAAAFLHTQPPLATTTASATTPTRWTRQSLTTLSATASSFSSSSAWSPPVYIPDDQPLYRLSDFALPQYLLDSGELEAVMLPAGLIHDRIDKMAQDLLADVATHPSPYSLHMLCVLKGAGRFYQALLDAVRARAQATHTPLKVSMEYVKVKSYSGMQSTGNVQVDGCDLEGLQGRHVVVVEDIIDVRLWVDWGGWLGGTWRLCLSPCPYSFMQSLSPHPPTHPPTHAQTGNTLRKLVPMLHGYHPSSIRVLALFQKRLGAKASKEPIPDLGVVGFSLPDKFAVGYGMGTFVGKERTGWIVVCSLLLHSFNHPTQAVPDYLLDSPRKPKSTHVPPTHPPTHLPSSDLEENYRDLEHLCLLSQKGIDMHLK